MHPQSMEMNIAGGDRIVPYYDLFGEDERVDFYYVGRLWDIENISEDKDLLWRYTSNWTAGFPRYFPSMEEAVQYAQNEWIMREHVIYSKKQAKGKIAHEKLDRWITQVPGH